MDIENLLNPIEESCTTDNATNEEVVRLCWMAEEEGLGIDGDYNVDDDAARSSPCCFSDQLVVEK